MMISYWKFNGKSFDPSVETSNFRSLISKLNFQIDHPVSFVILEELNTILAEKLIFPPKKQNHPFFYRQRAVPVVFFGFEDFHNTQVHETSSCNHFTEQENEILWEKIGIPRYYNFFDCNIWCFYISLKNSKIEKKLNDVLDRISNNYNQGLYNSSVAFEYIELQIRLASNAKIVGSNSHANSVSPFIFHSETLMRKKTEDKLKSFLSEIKWKCLLIDDYSDRNLSGESEIRKTKKEIIKEIINNDNIVVISVTHKEITEEERRTNIIWKALLELSSQTYDIILLDYLLGNKDYESEHREYSHELLNLINKILTKEEGYSIKNYSKIKLLIPTKRNPIDDEFINVAGVIDGIFKNKGPLNKFWFLNISSFHTAFLDRLREQGLGHNSEHWYLFRGADPVNTPELFRYSLFDLMNLQIREVEFNKKEISEHFKQYFNANIKDIRAWAKSYYQIFISKYGKIHILKSDSSSLFSSTYCKYFTDNRKVDIIYYEKMRNFLFLLANGSSSDSGQLQMSYMEISKEIEWDDEKEERRLVDYINTMH